MKLFKVTRKDGNIEVYLNSARIITLSDLSKIRTDGATGSHFFYDNTGLLPDADTAELYEVVETPEEILAQLK